MAANNYYHNDYSNPQQTSYNASGYHDHDRRNDAPLPPLPYDPSPSPSPFVDPYGQPSAAQPPSRYDADPYDDRNAIPLNEREHKHGSMHSIAPILPPQHPDDDPFVRDAKPGKRRRRGSDGRDGRVREDDDGWFRGKITWVCFFMSTVQLAVFLAELIKYGMLTGTPIQLKPSFNPMIGPSPYLYINMGARYQPCMHNMEGVQNAKNLPLLWPCPNTTSSDSADMTCTLSQLCGFGGVPDVQFPNLAEGEKLPNSPAPNQWWRFIVPIFLHGGIIHIAFNLLLQLTLGRDVEKLIGSVRFVIVYMAAGIFGFVLGGNFAATGIASTGASGSLFGILAITLLDLLYNWSTRKSPGKELLFIGIDIIIAFVLGLLPGLDNFSHIGGFLSLQQPSTSQISQVSEAYLLADADKLPVNAVLAMEVCDPREAPAKQGKFFQQVDSAIQDNQNVLAKSHEIELKVTNLPPDMQSLGENGSEETASLLEDRFSIAAAKEEFQKPVQEDFCSYWVNLISQCNTSATVMGNKALWDSQSKGLSVDPPMSENALSMERHQRRLAFFHLDGGTGNAEVERNQKGFRRSCPIVLLKHDNQKPSASGWSIILPISWVRVFWIPLVLAGAHAIGLRERRWLSSDAGLPSFPFDFPDCKAYECYMNEEAAAYEEMIARRPPLKRPPPILLPTPWSCIQRSVKIECTERLDLVGSIAGVEVEKSGSENMHNIDLVNSACRESEISEMMTNAGIHGPDSLSVKHMYSCFPGFIARTSAALKQHLKRSGGLHLLLFPEIDQKGKKNFFHLMDEGRLGWSLKGINNLIIERDPCFLRVLLYAPRKGAFEEGAVVCAPMQNDFAAWLSRSQRWQGLEIPSTLRNADCIQQQMSSDDMMESADIASMLGQENLRKPIGFVTTGVCRGSVPAMAVAICEGTILGRLRAEQWRENKWKRKCEIFVLVRNMRSTVYRPALAGIVIEELQDVIFS